MKNLYIPIMIAGIFFSACQSSSCHDENRTNHAAIGTEAHSHAHHHSTAHTSRDGAPSDLSIYNLDSEWINQNKEARKLGDFGGKVQLVAMVYTSCAYACPRIIADLRRIEESLDGVDLNQVGVVLVTLDPVRDTPEKLKEYAGKNNLNTKRWQLLSSTDNNIRELAALLNVKYKQELSMDINHSNVISVLNKDGEIVHQQEGLGAEPEGSVKAIKKLMGKI